LQVRRPSQGKPAGNPAGHPALETKKAVDTEPVLRGDWADAAHAAIIAIFVMLLIGFLDQTKVILIPLVAAVIIGLMLGPVIAFASRFGIPPAISALVLMVVGIAVLNLGIVMLSSSVIEWIQRAPEIGNMLKQKFQFLEQPLAALRDMRAAVGGSGMKVDSGEAALIAPVITAVTPAIGQLLLFFATLFFVLWGRSELRHHVITMFEGREKRLSALRILNEIEHDLTGYLSVVTVINLGVGICVGIGAWLLGFPSAAVWGILAFMLNYIPYVGPAIMVLVVFAVGLVTFPTLGHALIAPALYVGMTTLEGHIITPSIMGRRLTLNPLLVFLAVAFWTWLWGPVGTFLAVPLLIAGLVALNGGKPKVENPLPG
jgi:predicted PurR-regulated permease PerM